MINDNKTPLSDKDNKFYGNAFQDNDRKSNDSINPDNKSNLESKQILLELSKELKEDDIITRIFILKGKRNCIIVELNESYNRKKLIISVTNNWIRFINQTQKQMSEKNIEKNHIEHILDTLDNNYELIADLEDKRLDQPDEPISENIVVNPYDSQDYSNLTYGEWTTTLLTKRQSLKEIVKELIPEIWDPLEFSLSVMRILNIKDCSLPFAGIILGSPSSFKTVVIELLRGYPNTFYTDSFSPKSFVSHNTAVSQDMLKKIDLLPKIKGTIFLTPELSPIFSKRIEELIELLGIITRILDGHGYESDSGAQGHRGYNQKIMFTWIGAAVNIPYKVHKILGTLGPKLYFFRLSLDEKSEDYYLSQLQDEGNKNGFKQKTAKIKQALWDYLNWFNICPIAEKDQEGNIKIPWCSASDGAALRFNEASPNNQDDENALRIVIRLAKFLAHLRGVVPTWETKDHQGSDYAYTFPTIESPGRAIEQLKNLARGHALTQGRNYITMDDISLLIKIALSTASKERVIIFDYLLQCNGLVETNLIENHLQITKPTALRTMTELTVLEIVNKIELGGEDGPPLNQYQLSSKFDWFLSEEFKRLRDNFGKDFHTQFLFEREKK